MGEVCPLFQATVPIDPETAEMIKYAARLFATKITFINEVALLCEKAGADVTGVARYRS